MNIDQIMKLAYQYAQAMVAAEESECEGYSEEIEEAKSQLELSEKRLFEALLKNEMAYQEKIDEWRSRCPAEFYDIDGKISMLQAAEWFRRNGFSINFIDDEFEVKYKSYYIYFSDPDSLATILNENISSTMKRPCHDILDEMSKI